MLIMILSIKKSHVVLQLTYHGHMLKLICTKKSKALHAGLNKGSIKMSISATKIKKTQFKKPQVKVPDTAIGIFKQAACFVISLLFSRTVIMDGFSPFGIALCATVHPKYLIAALVGSGAGTFLSASVLSPYRYLGGVIGAALLSWAVFSFCSRRARRILPAVNAFVCALFTGIIMCIAEGFVLDQLFLYFAESVLCGGSAYFFQRALAVLSKKRGLKTLPLFDIVPILVSGAIALISLDIFQLGEFSPIRIFAVLLILIAARYGSVTGGALAGGVLGLGMGLSSGMVFLTGIYGFAGLMAGAFSVMGQAGSCGAFLMASVVMLVLTGDVTELLPLLLEIAAAGLVFMVLPRRICNRLDHTFNADLDVTPSGSLRDSLVVKLRFAGNTMSGVSRSIHSVNDKLRELSVPAYGSISKNLAQEVCAGCNLKSLCWKKEGALTIEGFRSLWDAVKADGQLHADNLPAILEERCIHTDRIIHSYNQQYQEYCKKESFENAVEHLREIVADQLEGMSDMLFDLSAEFEQAERYDVETAQRLKLIFNKYGISPRDVSCVTDKFERIRVEAHCPQPLPNLNNRKMHKEIASVCGRCFEDVNVTFAGHEALLTYCEKARLTLFVGTAQHASGNGKICGDSVEVMNDGKGHQVLMISDGMGTGSGAAIEGALASGMLARLLKAGFGFDCALRTVNSALLVKSGEESLATLDIASVDLFNGRAEFYKAGASSSFIVKQGSAWKVELPSLPAGILREVEFAKTSAFLAPGDKLVLFSDGIADSETLWLERLLEQAEAHTPQALAEYILAEARRRRAGDREDDMTVIVGEVQLNR